MKPHNSTKIKIEKGIPIPGIAGTRGRPPKYPHRHLEVGDSILIPFAVASANVVSATVHQYARRHGRKVQTRKEKKGTRVWRIQ